MIKFLRGWVVVGLVEVVAVGVVVGLVVVVVVGVVVVGVVGVGGGSELKNNFF